MTKEEMITWLEGVLEQHKDGVGNNLQASIAAADLLAALKGWRTQHCSRQNRPMRDSRLNKIGSNSKR